MKKQIIKDPTYNIYSKGGNVEKAIPGRGDGSAKKQLADLEKKEFEEGMLKRKLENQLFAGGGIAKLAGVSSGVAPVSGPNSQGLLSLKNRVRNY